MVRTVPVLLLLATMMLTFLTAEWRKIQAIAFNFSG